MKLADDALIALIEMMRSALMEGRDISSMLRAFELEQNSQGKLSVANPSWQMTNETD